jgi:hypothetical protein
MSSVAAAKGKARACCAAARRDLRVCAAARRRSELQR